MSEWLGYQVELGALGIESLVMEWDELGPALQEGHGSSHPEKVYTTAYVTQEDPPLVGFVLEDLLTHKRMMIGMMKEGKLIWKEGGHDANH